MPLPPSRPASPRLPIPPRPPGSARRRLRVQTCPGRTGLGPPGAGAPHPEVKVKGEGFPAPTHPPSQPASQPGAQGADGKVSGRVGARSPSSPPPSRTCRARPGPRAAGPAGARVPTGSLHSPLAAMVPAAAAGAGPGSAPETPRRAWGGESPTRAPARARGWQAAGGVGTPPGRRTPGRAGDARAALGGAGVPEGGGACSRGLRLPWAPLLGF